MTDMAELVNRKQPINLSIVHVDPDAFIESYVPWLEIASFLMDLKEGQTDMPADGKTPIFTDADYGRARVHTIANDTIFAFCMNASLKGDGEAVDKVETSLKERMGPEFPGNFGLWYFRGTNEAPVSLEDFVGQAGKKMLAGEIPPPPKRGSEAWDVGFRFLEKARSSNFKSETLYPLAKWTRDQWNDATDKGVAFLSHIEDNLPVLREALEEPRNDEPFIADILLKGAPALGIELQEEVEGMLRSLSRR